MTLVKTIAEFAVAAEIPGEARLAGRAAVADCVGCILAGARTATVEALVAGLAPAVGAATLIGRGGSADARTAALVNGTAGHALDYDDIDWHLYGHPSTVAVPALLAFAEAEGSRSGADLLDAYAVGVEVMGKLGLAINPGLYLRGWHATATIGVIGTTAACARLAGLDAKRAANAIAIAASQAAGVRENFGTMVKPLHAGRAAEAAVLGVALARAGFTGSLRALDGRFGYFRVLADAEPPDATALASTLGAPWEVSEPGIVLKRYPSCGATHCALDALLDLKGELTFEPADIDRIICGAEPLALKVLQYPMPETGLEGKFSMQFCLALAAIEGPPRLAHFDREWVTSPAVRDLITRIDVADRPDLAGERNDAVPATVEVILRDGRRAERTVLFPRGDPRNPMTQGDRRAKFLDCAAVLAPAVCQQAFDALETLETAGDVGQLVTMLAVPPAGRRAGHG